MGVDPDGSRWYRLLRSPGYFDFNAAYIQIDGIIFHYGDDVDYPEYGLRPALWMKNRITLRVIAGYNRRISQDHVTVSAILLIHLYTNL